MLSACTGGNLGSPPEDAEAGTDPQPTNVVLHSVAGGAFKAMAPYTGIAGRALMVRRLDGKSELSIELTGTMPSVMYTAHLHAAPCQYAGGGHYKIDPAVADVIETNELWLRGTSSPTGVLMSEGSWSHATRGEALSIVLHDPAGGAKMACADLLENNVETVELAGTVTPFAQATGIDMTITGMTQATRTSGGTTFTVNLSGLERSSVYESHIHAEPCAVTAAGGHYKLDPTVVATVPANELWPAVRSSAAGASMSTLQTPHVIRTDAQSFVVHRVISDTNKPKVACAELARTTSRSSLQTSGNAIPLAAAGGLSLTGSAIMTRKLTGVTEVALVMTGLTPHTKYAAHVHDRSCAVENGGGHFKFDPTIMEALPENELWFELATDAEGTAHDSTWVSKLAGASAASLVVHAPDNARLACFDLQ